MNAFNEDSIVAGSCPGTSRQLIFALQAAGMIVFAPAAVYPP